ncbi:MAG TPA: DUF1175 family protein [Blastocatellia bacterium]|nr:DUF1175 family protein [Blastocatellia bacterium]
MIVKAPTSQLIVKPMARTFCLILCCLFALSCGRTSQERFKKTARAEKTAITPAPISWTDNDSDGFPDSAELSSSNDRESFRRWFCAIAEMQFYRMSDEWNEEQRDCAGLVRFAMREALRRHDRLWFQKMGEGYESIAPDVRAFTLERGPLKEKLFRTDFGSFKEADLNNKFSEFADARTLKNYNATFISRNREQAQPGDLLFFHQPYVQKYPYHVMVFLGTARHAGEGANDWVAYHTGSSPHDAGTMKKVRLSVLAQHPNKRWRPVEHNKYFLGFYRPNILN